MNSVKISLLFAAIISSNQLIAMQNLQSIAGSGARRTDTRAPWGKPGSLQRLLNKKNSDGKAADTDDDALGGAAGEESPTTAVAVTSPSLTGTGVKTSPILPPVPPTSPKSRSATSSPSPKFGCAAGAGAGTGTGSGEAASAEIRGYDGDNDEAGYESDSDKSIRYANEENPPLSALVGSSYAPSSLSGLITRRPNHYANVLSAIQAKKSYDPREAEKVFTQLGHDVDALQIAELACAMGKCSKQNKTIKPTIPTLVDLENICKAALEAEAKLMMEQVATQAKKLQKIKKGLAAISDLYHKVGGSVAEERNSNWGIGRDYKEPVDSYVQVVKRADQLLKDAAKKAKAAESFEDLA